jgi:exosome complex component CSL4
MTVVQGTFVLPGEVIAVVVGDADEASAGDGVYARKVLLSGKRQRSSDTSDDALHPSRTRAVQLVASRMGAVQWDERVVSVFGRHEVRDRLACPGPRAGDVVHMRVHRVTHSHVFGDIVAIGGRWASAPSLTSTTGGFKGVLRVEDIRPFKVTNKQQLPPPPSAAVRPGDLVAAVVLGESDAKQCQLSTVEEHCGVVEAYSSSGHHRLAHIRGRRDAMLNTTTGLEESRWTPITQ